MFGLQSRQLRGVHSGWTTARDLCLLALIAALAAFMLHSLFIGGDAFRGYSEHGRYFVRLHTAVTEVTPDQWRLNWLFGAAVFTLLPLSLIVTTIAVYRERHDRFRYDDMDV
jgi:hypothetical protein